MAARVLCIGVDPLLLNTRCAVLRYAGYEALSAMPYDADELLQTELFDLVILSMLLSDSEKVRFTKIKGDLGKVLNLENFVPADELLKEVKKRLDGM